MKILFFYPNINLPLRINHGIAALSAILKKAGHEVALRQFNTKESLRNLACIVKFKPQVIAISSCTTQWEVAKFLAEKLKKQYNLKIFVGGPHPTVYPDCLLETTAIDGICRGEGEIPLLELLNRLSCGKSFADVPSFWIRDGKDIIRNEISPLMENLDDLPIPDWSLFDKESIYAYPCFSFSRGCLYACTYCINSALRSIYSGKGTYVRLKSVKRAIEEIKDKVAEYDLKILNFDDDVFIKDKRWFSDFCLSYQKEVSLPFNCVCRPENINQEACSMLKQTKGHIVGIGIESGDVALRSRILGRFMSDDIISRAFKIAREEGLKTYSFNMVGIPDETPDLFMKTIRLNREILPDEAQLSIFYHFSGTPLGELCKEKGYIKHKTDYGFFGRSILELPGFSQREIHKWYDRFEYLVYRDTNLLKALKFRITKFIYRRPILHLICAPFFSGVKRLLSFIGGVRVG